MSKVSDREETGLKTLHVRPKVKIGENYESAYLNEIDESPEPILLVTKGHHIDQKASKDKEAQHKLQGWESV